MGYSPLELDPVVLPLVEGKTVLDLGCGYGRWGYLLRTQYQSTSAELRAHITGVDIHQGNVAFCRSLGVYDELVTTDALEFLATSDPAAFDTVLAVELIEHLPKAAGERLLSEVIRVAARVAILTTPNWEYLRPGANGLTGYNEYEHHVCRWTASEFRARGFAVRGVGHKIRMWPLRGVNRLLNRLPTLDLVIGAWSVRHPSLARQLLAYRRA